MQAKRQYDENYPKETLADPKWFEKRKIILQRDNNQCVICGQTEGLQVHHKQYHFRKRFGKISYVPLWDYSNKYLVTLCQSCHQRGHSKFGKVPRIQII